MKNWTIVILILLTTLVFWFIKFFLEFPVAEIEIVKIVLTVASILFGFLAGFFISELWTRYTEIRMLEGVRASKGLNMIKCAEHFFKNKEFEEEFKKLVEKSAVVDEIVEWNEGHLEIPYYRAVENSFKHLKIENQKDGIYFDHLLNSYHKYVETTVRLDILGKERLFLSEWVIMVMLSLMIILSVLFLDISQLFYKIIVFALPSIIVLALFIMYKLDTLLWSKEIVTLEPNERIFDALGLKRFYLKKKRGFIHPSIKDYRTEEDLRGELKQVYLNLSR